MKHNFKIILNRLSSVRRDLAILLIAAFVTIILIEFWLINISSPNKFFYHFGQFTLKLSYSYFSAFIFYFLVIHLPLEKRKAKSFRQLNNKILEIDSHFKEIISLIMKQSDVKANEVSFTDACKGINPQNPVNIPPYNPSFSNFYEFLNFKGSQIKQIINELLILNNSIDSEIFELLTFVDDETSRFMFVRKQYGNQDLTHLVGRLSTASANTSFLFSTFRKKYLRYRFESNYNYKVINNFKNIKSRHK